MKQIAEFQNHVITEIKEKKFIKWYVAAVHAAEATGTSYDDAKKIIDGMAEGFGQIVRDGEYLKMRMADDMPEWIGMPAMEAIMWLSWEDVAQAYFNRGKEEPTREEVEAVFKKYTKSDKDSLISQLWDELDDCISDYERKNQAD